MNTMTRVRQSVVAVAILAVAAVGPAAAQERPAAPAPKVMTPLKITVVISRYQGERKSGSLPFTLWVNANGRSTSLRMGASVAVPAGGVQAGNPIQSYSYRDIGTKIDSTAESLDENRFSISLSIEDSQVFSDATKPAGSMAGLPAFQSFSSSMVVILKDGQSAQYTTATDKVSGEVVKVDVTLNVIH